MKKRDRKKKSISKLVTGMLLGSAVGALVGWLSAPVSGGDLRRRMAGEIEVGNDNRRSARGGNPHPIREVNRSANRHSLEEKIKTAEGNVESQARELAADFDENARDIKTAIFHYRNTTST